MTAGFNALGDDCVDACLGRGLGFIDRPDLKEYLHALIVRLPDVRLGIAPEEDQQGDLRLEAGFELAFLRMIQNPIHAKRLVSRRTERVNLLTDNLGRQPGRAENPAGAGIRYGGS